MSDNTLGPSLHPRLQQEPRIAQRVNDTTVAKLLEEKVPCSAESLRIKIFSLWDLYGNFISKSFDTYFKDKSGMDVKNNQSEKNQPRKRTGNNNHDNHLLCVSRCNGENLPGLLGWLCQNFTDSKFLEEQILGVTESNKFGILHYAFWGCSNETLLNLLDEIQSCGEILGKDLIQRLIFIKDEYNNLFLVPYAENKNFDTDFLIPFLGKIKVILDSDDASYLSKIIFHCGENNQCFLNYFCLFAKNFDLLKFLKWLHDSFGLDQLKKLLSKRDNIKESIIFQFFSNYQNPITNGLDILNYLFIYLAYKSQSFLFNLNQVIDKDLMKILQYLFENEKQYLELNV